MARWHALVIAAIVRRPQKGTQDDGGAVLVPDRIFELETETLVLLLSCL